VRTAIPLHSDHTSCLITRRRVASGQGSAKCGCSQPARFILRTRRAFADDTEAQPWSVSIWERARAESAYGNGWPALIGGSSHPFPCLSSILPQAHRCASQNSQEKRKSNSRSPLGTSEHRAGRGITRVRTHYLIFDVDGTRDQLMSASASLCDPLPKALAD
jgi:hypothetical protein